MTASQMQANEPARVRPFCDFLRETAKGATHEEMSEALRDLVGRVTDTGKKGTLTLVITIAPMKGDDSVLVVSDEIKLKLPEHDRSASLFYADADGNLTRDDPSQLTFEGIREVASTATGEIRTLPAKEIQA